MKKADHQLVQQLLDGEMTPEDFAAFQQRLRSDPAFEKLYTEYALLHHTLSEEFDSARPGESSSSPPVRHAVRIAVWSIIAAAVLLVAFLWWFSPWSDRIGQGEPVAVVTFSVDAVWRIDGEAHNLGGATGVSRGGGLHLSQGRASISLEPSVLAVLEGPAAVTFDSPMSLHLAKGRGYFHHGGSGGGLIVTTPRFRVEVSGTEFGIEISPDDADELHVIDGRVTVVAASGGESLLLDAGEAVRVAGAGPMTKTRSDGRSFPTHLGRFRSVLSGPFVKSAWRIEYGAPSITGSRIEGSNYSAFLRLPEPVPGDEGTVMLATLETGKPAEGAFHTDGWAGMSFYSGGEELVFFGDSFGSRQSWGLDVKQRIPVIYPQEPVLGARLVTLRYDLRTGEVSLHEGTVPLKEPFCTGKIPAGTRFDEIRFGASAGAAFAVNSLEIRVGGD
jgi:hypothetical protein